MTDHPISVPAPAALASSIRHFLRNAWQATLVGNPAPVTSSLGDRIGTPRVGDLVAEVSTIAYGNDVAAVGYLERIADEAVVLYDGTTPRDAQTGAPVHETVHYIRGLDGRQHRWRNARFLAAATSDLYDFNR